VVKVAASTTGGRAPLTVTFTSAGTKDPDGDRLVFDWDFDGDGKVDSHRRNPTHTYAANGSYHPTLKVTDRTKRSASAYAPILVGNQPPVLTMQTTPKPGDPFNFGDTIRFTVSVVDDQPVDCSKVIVSYVLGHEQHGPPQSATAGCSGSVTTTLDTGHAGAANLSVILGASYTDPGQDGQPGLTGTVQVRLEPPAAP